LSHVSNARTRPKSGIPFQRPDSSKWLDKNTSPKKAAKTLPAVLRNSGMRIANCSKILLLTPKDIGHPDSGRGFHQA
jgi:hypothetical protein